jgi:hypothetical protein
MLEVSADESKSFRSCAATSAICLSSVHDDGIQRTLETTPVGATHWSLRSMAKSSGSVKHGQRHTPHRIHLGPDAIHGDAVLPRREESLLALATTRCGVAVASPA